MASFEEVARATETMSKAIQETSKALRDMATQFDQILEVVQRIRDLDDQIIENRL